MYYYYVTIKSKIKESFGLLDYYNVKYYYLRESDKNTAIQKATALISNKKLKILGEVEVEIEKKFSNF